MYMVAKIYWVITHVSKSRMVYFAIYLLINARTTALKIYVKITVMFCCQKRLITVNVIFR